MLSKTFVFLIFTSLILGFCFVFQHTIVCSAKTISVDDSGGQDYTTIQEAIDAADPGDTVYVYSGTYYENINITKDLTLTGENKDTTIIDGTNKRYVIRAYDPPENEHQVSISGFTIRKAGGTGNDCIAFTYIRNGNIADNNILNSAQSSGIQLGFCTNSIIHDNTIANNYEYGIHLSYSTEIRIYNNHIQDNQRGIYIDYSSNNNQIYANEITANRYGISVFSSNTIFYYNDFTNNDIKNAEDSGTNTWSYNNEGNYWDDYTGEDSNPPYGIGDTPYTKNGVNDLYPLGYFQQAENQKPIATIDTPESGTVVSYHTSVYFSGHGIDPDSGGSITGYRWESNTYGQFSTAQSFATSSLPAGTHTISFLVLDNEGLWSDADTIILTVNAPVNQPPTATISSINPPQAIYGTMIYFNGQGTDTEGGAIVAYQWESSLDGVLNTQTSFATANLSVGTHTISFKVRDNNGAWSTPASRSLTITSTSQTNTPPVAIAAGLTTGVVNTSLSFNATTSYDTDGTITIYRWDFGDDTTQTGILVQHTYTTPGNYTVTLSVTDNNGVKTTDTMTVIITTHSESTNNNGNTNNHNGNGQNGGDFSLDFDIPILLIAPIIVIVFIIIIVAFYIRIKRT